MQGNIIRRKRFIIPAGDEIYEII
ncbi:hypothetical protein ACFQ1Y_10260 [Virgibacillus alimentarius]